MDSVAKKYDETSMSIAQSIVKTLDNKYPVFVNTGTLNLVLGPQNNYGQKSKESK
jgi:hypothetical protein